MSFIGGHILVFAFQEENISLAGEAGLKFYYVSKKLGKEVEDWCLELQMKSLKVSDFTPPVSFGSDCHLASSPHLQMCKWLRLNPMKEGREN